MCDVVVCLCGVVMAMIMMVHPLGGSVSFIWNTGLVHSRDFAGILSKGDISFYRDIWSCILLSSFYSVAWLSA